MHDKIRSSGDPEFYFTILITWPVSSYLNITASNFTSTKPFEGRIPTEMYSTDMTAAKLHQRILTAPTQLAFLVAQPMNTGSAIPNTYTAIQEQKHDQLFSQKYHEQQEQQNLTKLARK